jgi:O-antigen ligase
MLDPGFRLATSLVVLALMAAVLLPAATDGLGRYGALQMFLAFGMFFAWNAVVATRTLLRREGALRRWRRLTRRR